MAKKQLYWKGEDELLRTKDFLASQKNEFNEALPLDEVLSENNLGLSANRRDFLKNTGLIAASAIFSPHVLLKATQPQKTKLGIALVGLGYYSTDLIAPALLKTDHCELKGIVTGTPSKVEIWKSKYGLADKNIYIAFIARCV